MQMKMLLPSFKRTELKMKNTFKNNSLFKSLMYGFLGGVILLTLAPWFLVVPPVHTGQRAGQQDNSTIRTDSVELTGNDSCVIRRHNIKWADYSGKNFSANLQVCVSDFVSARQNRSETYAMDYERLVQHDKAHLNAIASEMVAISNGNTLNFDQSVQMMVSMIQHIPYHLVIPESKAEHMAMYEARGRTNAFSYQYLKEGRPYIDNIKMFGVQSPTEFMYNLKGDCDTRTVFLYTLLKKLNVDVIVLNSDIQGHSILGVVLKGDRYGRQRFYDKSSGKNYLVWETTAEGFPPGVMPDYNPREWYIALN